MATRAQLLEGLGIEESELQQEMDTPSVKDVITDWGNKLIADLQDSLVEETSTGTSRALFQSIKATPEQKGSVLVWTLSMLDYYDYINKGVEGIGGDPRGKKPTLKQYRFTGAPIKIDNSLRQWANAKGLSEYALSWSIARRGIEKTEWYDKVVTQERVNKLIEDVAEAGAEQLAVGLKLVLENGN